MPDWVDHQSFLPGCRLFHRHTRLVLAGMVGGTLVEGFTTNIAKSFFLTGRLRDKGQRRLKQNNRHMLEIFMPGGLDRKGRRMDALRPGQAGSREGPRLA